MRGIDCSNGEHTTVNTSTTSVMLHDLAPNAEYSVEAAVTTSVGTVGPYSSESALYHRYCSTVTQEVVKWTHSPAVLCVKKDSFVIWPHGSCN